jgi:Zn-dependent metalloprotease
MKLTRSLLARTLRVACLAALGFGVTTADATPGAPEANSAWMTFSQSEGLRAGDAQSILSKRLDLRSGTDELRPAFDQKPGNGLEVQRFNQYFKGLHVVHGSYVLASMNGVATYAFGKFFRLNPGTSITPALSEADALSKAMKSTGASQYAWQVDPKESKPAGELVFVEDFSSGTPDGQPRLAYAFDIYAAEPLSRDMVFVDAQTGNILLRDAIMKHVAAKAKSLYSDTVTFEAGFVNGRYALHDSTRGNGIFTFNVMNATPSASQMLNNPAYRVDDTSVTTTFPTGPAIDAHWGAEVVYDYWKTQHGRNSWNGLNGPLYSFVHYGLNYANAMWNGSAMVYGDGSGGVGPFTALDICGHEIGHGVCQSTAGLVYRGESGGMNEGFSDIWGSLIENYGDPKERDVVAKNMWLIGEEIGTTLRDMSNPKRFGQPSTYLGQNWIYTGSGCDYSNDNCGVHTTSGVLNYWFYLLVSGGKGTNDNGDNYQVAGIGTIKAGAIAYATELTLNATSNYASARAASILAATTLYGACSPELEAVTRAWYAVGVGNNFSACKPEVSFEGTTMTVQETANANGCSASHVVNVPIILSGPAPTGGTAAVTVTAIGGTAVAGVDYSLASPAVVSFGPGVTTPQSVSLTIYDNGYQTGNKYVDLVLALTPNGSTLTKASVMDTIRVVIANDDRAPQLGTSEFHSVGAISGTADNSSPFMSARIAGRGQYIYSAAELSAASLRAGVPITEAAFFVSSKGSTQPFTGYTVKMGLTNQTSFSTNFLNDAGFTTVYSANYTTKAGWSNITFSTPFVWDGTSNIVVQVCYTNAGAIGPNDKVTATANGSSAATAWGVSNGCSLPLTPANISYNRPVVRFTQDVPPASIATNAGDTRSWNVDAGNAVYFYNHPDQEIIATVLGAYQNLGCVTARISQAGNGFRMMPPSGKQRSLKEFEITSANPPAQDTFDVILYLTDAERAGVNPSDLYLLHTTAATDAAMTSANTSIQPAKDLIYGQNWTGFRGTFYGFGRYYITTGEVLGTSTIHAKDQNLWTGANPFRDAPVLYWNLNAPERVSIRLFDITGKTVFTSEQTLQAGSHSLSLQGNRDYAPGTYILQVVRPGNVFTRQMLKQ